MKRGRRAGSTGWGDRGTLGAFGGGFRAAGGVSHSAPPSGHCAALRPPEGVLLGIAETPRHERPGTADAETPRGMGACVFMAPRCWPLPFPALKPNPNRSFLSGGCGDYLININHD